MLDHAEALRILGLPLGASRTDVKDAFRKKALATHPDLNKSPEAVEEYSRIRTAADLILNEAGYDASKFRQHQSEKRFKSVDRLYRLPKFPLYFSAASVVAGCFIFYGALQTHRTVFNGYSYDVATEAEKRRANPSPEQERINMLLMQKREERLVKK